jgi:hypothetical protein
MRQYGRGPVGLVERRGFSSTKCRGRCWGREDLTKAGDAAVSRAARHGNSGDKRDDG